jgi:hypothetical protein
MYENTTSYGKPCYKLSLVSEVVKGVLLSGIPSFKDTAYENFTFFILEIYQ